MTALQTIAGFDRIGEENAFAVLARATELARQGRDIINLGIGQPDFRTPDHIVEAAVKALPRGSALLVVRRGSNAGSRYLLNTDVVTAGRHQDSDIFLDDISVSRRHATFTRTDEGILVRDLGSLNGTYVNRDLVEEQLLRHGDEVQIGKFRLVFFASPHGAE